MNHTEKTSATLVASLLALLAAPAAVFADTVDETFIPESVLVSDPESPVVDFEPEPVFYRFAWVDTSGDMWAGRVDKTTGELVPPDGKGQLLDTQVAKAREFLNGPEWALTNSGPQVVYTRSLPFGPQLHKAYFDRGGWVTEALRGGIYKYGPYGSLDRGDPSPRVFYKGPADLAFPEDPAEAFYWRYLDQPGSETKFGDRISPTRWVPGYQQILYTAIPEGVPGRIAQVYLYDVETDSSQQLTTSSGSKASPRIWTAPDLGNSRILEVATDRESLEVYIETIGPGGESEWTLLHDLVVPEQSVGPYIYNARPFVHGAQSYIVMLAMECLGTCDGKYTRRGGLTDVWLVGSLDGEPAWRRISDPVGAFREDPETLPIQGSPYVYIYRFASEDETPDGVYKLATGL